jgi:hypothetical protein
VGSRFSTCPFACAVVASAPVPRFGVVQDRLDLASYTRPSPDSYLRRILAANEPIEAFKPSMLSLDDPDHKRIRGLASTTDLIGNGVLTLLSYPGSGRQTPPPISSSFTMRWTRCCVTTTRGADHPGSARPLNAPRRKPGLPPLPPARVERAVALTLAQPPGEATHWTGDGRR